MRISVEGSSRTSRRMNVDPGGALSSSHARTTQPSPSGLRRLLSSWWSCRSASDSDDGFSLITRTRPNRAPTASTYLQSVGAISRFAVHIPSLSGLPWSQKPAHSISPFADASGAEFGAPARFQVAVSQPLPLFGRNRRAVAEHDRSVGGEHVEFRVGH